MANDEDLARLLQCVAAWNDWQAQNRKQNRKPRVDLRGAKLGGAHLERADLRGADLFAAKLEGAHLERADLRLAHLEGTNLFWAHLERADLRLAHLERADLRHANLRQATLVDSRLAGANLTDAKLWETQRAGWSIEGVICQQAFWDRDGKEPTEYGVGDFERIFAENV